MSWNRREILGGLGVASAHALLWAFGCGPPKPVRRAPETVSGEVRTWLRDAISTLAGAGLAGHALAVSRQRSTAAADVLGATVAHARCDGVVLTARDPRGMREQVTSELTRDGVMAAARALAGGAKQGHVDFGPPPQPAAVPKPDPDRVQDAYLLDGLAAIAERDRKLSAAEHADAAASRIVYAANLVDIDDAMVWSVAAGRDLEQRLYRVRRSLTRVAWNGTRPFISEVSRGWSGGLNDQTFTDAEISAARDGALALLTPGSFADGEHALVLAPDVVAAIIDAAVRTLLVTTAERRPEVASRLAVGAAVASPVITLTDDPTVAGAYGGFQFDDLGAVASPVVLVDRGRVVGRVARGRRPGHVGAVEPFPSHLRLAPGTVDEVSVDDGFMLEGATSAIVDPSSDRVIVAVQRALELEHGKRSGRIYADVELVGELGALLASIGDASKATRTIAMRDEVDGQPRWRSIEAPFVRGKGTIRARRRAQGTL